LISGIDGEWFRTVVENDNVRNHWMMPRVEEQQNLSPPKPPASGSALPVNPEHWVEKYGDVLFGFAASRVRDRTIAQDLVQETFLAAINARESFVGRASERAWLFGILRHKLIDHYRLQDREVPFLDLDSPLPEEQGAFGASGLGKDGWVKAVAPKAWETPEEILVRKEFQDVLKCCLSRLPDKVAQVFALREIDGVSSEKICKDLGVSPTNVWVMLHRARMGLRRCLEVHWFGDKRINK
jgi:RNA polymerase sigma-70 factor, ECF subfamily